MAKTKKVATKKVATQIMAASTTKSLEPKKVNLLTAPSHNYEPTSDPDIFRVVDWDGDWTHYWRKSTGVYVPAVNHVIKNGFNKGIRFMSWLLKVNEEEAKRILESAGDRGSRVHMAIRDLINGVEVKLETKYPSDLARGRFDPLTNEEWKCIRGFMNWLEDHKPETFLQEQTVWSPHWEYAGTADFIGTIEVTQKRVTNRIPVLIDWKTSSGIYDDHKLQTASYWKAYLDNPPVNVVKGTRLLPTHTAVVRVGTNHKVGYEMKLYGPEETMDHFTKFLAVRELHEFVEPAEKSRPVIEEIPIAFKIDVPKWQSTEKPKKKTTRPRTSKSKKK